MSRTTISVSRETRDRLAELGKKDDSFSDIIVRLLSEKGNSNDNDEPE